MADGQRQKGNDVARILILTPQIPYPARQGASLRNLHIIRGLAERHEVSLLSFREPEQGVERELAALCAGGVEVVDVLVRTTADRLRDLLGSFYPDMGHRLYSPEFAHKLTAWLRRVSFDVVQVEGIELARYMSLVRYELPGAKVVFDNHNAETELQRRTFLTDLRQPKRWVPALYSAVQVLKLRRFERWACATADAVTVVSAADADLLAGLVRGLRAHIIPNSLDVLAYRERLAGLDGVARPYDLLFMGKMDYRPNVDGMVWFVEAIWPHIVAARPETTVAIVGQKPHERLRAAVAGQPRITLTGFVDSVLPYLAGARLFVMPLRLGSGTRLKFIEACAAGKPIVTTPVGAEGFAIAHGREAFVAAEPVAFAEGVLGVLGDEARAGEYGRVARAFAQQYDWRVVVPRFEAVYELASLG